MLSHSNSFGENATTDTAGCRACYRKYIVEGELSYGNSLPALGYVPGISAATVASDNWTNGQTLDFGNVVINSGINDTRPLVVVAIRGSSGGADWGRNLASLLSSLNPEWGFIVGVNEVLANLNAYLDADRDGNGTTLRSQGPVILITGHSHGAAVGNLLAAHLNSSCADPNCCDGCWDEEDIYAYTFATRVTTWAASPAGQKSFPGQKPWWT